VKLERCKITIDGIQNFWEDEQSIAKNHYPMIAKLSSNMREKYNLPYDELDDIKAEGYLILVESLRTFDPAKAKFTTHLYTNLIGRLNNYCRDRANNNPHTHDEIPDVEYNDREYSSFWDEVEKLSCNAQEVIRIIFNTPTDVILQSCKNKTINTRRISQNKLRHFLRSKGWFFPTIQSAFTEIRENLL